MSIKKYIRTTEVVKLTGLSYDEILGLAHNGTLDCHKTRRGYWKFKVEDVEKYFGITINNPTEEDNKPKPTKKIQEEDKKVYNEKLISGHTARKYLNCTKAEFENLVNKGVIQAYRDEDNRWKVSKESVLRCAENPLPMIDTRLVLNESHYQDVIQRICSAKTSIRIMTANFKRFNLKPTDNQGDKYNDGTPFVKYLMAKAVQGISVQIICSKPSSNFTDEWTDYYRQMNPELFEYKFCERNHAKVIIIDDMYVYIGSANVTPAGLGQGIFTPGNFEVGVFTNNPDFVTSANDLFSMIWDEKCCNNCHRAQKCNEKQ